MTATTYYTDVTSVKNYAGANKTETGKESWKLYGFTSQATFDTWLGELIGDVDVSIDDYVGHDFWRHPVSSEATGLYDGQGHSMLSTNFPILSLSKVEIGNQSTGSVAWSPLLTTDYEFYERYVMFNLKLPRGFKNIRLTYAYGYDSVPLPVTLAANRIMANILQGILLRSTSPIVRVDNFVVEQTKELAFTDDIKASLTRYRRVPFAVTQA